MTSPSVEPGGISLAPEIHEFPVRESVETAGQWENLRFFLKWLSQPCAIGAPLSSGSSLAHAMSRCVARTQPGVVVELGGGSGAITHALLHSGTPPGRLIVIEQDPQFFKLLVSRFPSVQVLLGNALDLHRMLQDVAVDTVTTIVSGLPLRAMPVSSRQRIVRQSFECLAPDGTFLQFSYGVDSPLPLAILDDLDLTVELVARVWRNLPPAKVWRYARAT